MLQSSQYTPQYKQVASLRARIEDQQRLLILYVEEKVALASQAQDIIEHHLQRLNHDMREFEEEIKVVYGGSLWWFIVVWWLCMLFV